MIFWYGMAWAIAWRTFGLSNGGLVTFMPIYWMPLENGSDTTSSLPLAFISWKSLNGNS